MQSEYKLNSNLLSALNENILNPFIVFDKHGNILSINKEATTLLSVQQTPRNIFDLVDESYYDEIRELFKKSISQSKPYSENIRVLLKSGEELNLNLSINKYIEEGQLFLFCSLKEEKFIIEPKGKASLKVITGEVSDVITNKQIISVLEQVKSLYPFTFIGKEKIRKEINSLEESFWIKDNEGRYVIVNDKLAQSLGVKTTQLEGKYEKSFIPEYFLTLYGSVEKFIQESLNSVIIEGIPLKGIAFAENFQTIEIPLSDADNNVIAIIGIIQKTRSRVTRTTKTEIKSVFDKLLNSIPIAAAMLGADSTFKHANKDFCKLLLTNIDKLRGLKQEEVFSEEVAGKLKAFLELSDTSQKFDFFGTFTESFENLRGYKIALNKIFNKERQLERIIILIEEDNSENELEKIIIRRGRMFEILIKNNPEPIYIYDKENLRFLEVNDAALNLYGFRRDEFLQMDLTDLYTPEDIQTLLDSSAAKTREGNFGGPYRHKRKDGAFILVEISKISFKFKDRDAHFNIIKDVTEKLELEKKAQIFKSAFEHTDDLLFITDSSGFISYVNKEVLGYLNYSREDIIDSSFASLVRDEERGTINTTIFHSHLKDSVTIVMDIKRKGGNFREVEITASPILNYNGEIDSFVILGKYEKDVKPPKEIIKEVIKEVIVEKPVKIKEEASVIDQNQTAFLSSMFHEILTPINVILGFVQELTGSIKTLSPEQKEAASIIDQNRNSLLSIMNSVVEYSNIEQGKTELSLREISITEIIDQIQKDIENFRNVREVEFAYGKISSSLNFISDKQKFQHLVSLLLKIIIQLSKAKKIYFSAILIDEETFAISVKDSYSSVSDNLLNNISAIFQKDETSIDKDYGISKLTSRLAKQLLSLLKGNFEIIEKDTGRFDYGFIFPIDYTAYRIPQPEEEIVYQQAPSSFKIEETESEETEEIVSSESAEEISEKEEKELFEEEETKEYAAGIYDTKSSGQLDLSRLRCLYIEDQVDSQILFKVQMKELKEIKFAVSFEEALPLLDSDNFDFIVMDINLQGEYNGLDALKIIHKMSGYEKIPIVAVTAYVLPGDKEKFIATGFHDFISKPIFREKMIDSLEKIFLMQM